MNNSKNLGKNIEYAFLKRNIFLMIELRNIAKTYGSYTACNS